MESAQQSAPVHFSALNRNLPRLAAKAALDLDLVLLDPTTEFDFPESANLLLDKLKSMETSSLWREAPGSALFLQDPLNGDVFQRSLVAANLSSLSALYESARSVAENPSSDKVSLTKSLRDFFIALSDFASRKRDSVLSSNHNATPYRMG